MTIDRTKMGTWGDVLTVDLTGDEWVTSDLHLGHHNVITYSGRPFYYCLEMDETLIHKWNQVVGPDDTVLIPGDVAFKGTTFKSSMFPRLNGYKVLIKGNHDAGRESMIKCGFQEAYLMARGQLWDGRSYIMTHVPMRGQSHKADVMLCGHVHEKWCFSEPNFYNVGTDQWDFQPQRIKTVLEQARERQAKLPVQNTVSSAWVERDNRLVNTMYEQFLDKHDKKHR